MARLLSQISGSYSTERKKSAEFIIAPIRDDGSVDTDLGGAKILQYWPESITKPSTTNWSPKQPFGSPLPIYQWISGSESTFSCTCSFSRDADGEIGKDVIEDAYNVDIEAAIAWLTMLKTNDYADIGDVKGACIAPPVVWVCTQNTYLNPASYTGLNSFEGQDPMDTPGGIYCLITDVSANRTAWFPSGRTRMATVDVTFAQTMQYAGVINTFGRQNMLALANKYTRKPSK